MYVGLLTLTQLIKMTKLKSPDTITIATFGNALREFKELSNKDLQLSFFRGCVWGLAVLILICIASWFVEVMRTRIFYSGSLITTYPQQLPQVNHTVATPQPERRVPQVQIYDNYQY